MARMLFLDPTGSVFACTEGMLDTKRFWVERAGHVFLQEANSRIHAQHLAIAYGRSGATEPQNYTPEQIKELIR